MATSTCVLCGRSDISDPALVAHNNRRFDCPTCTDYVVTEIALSFERGTDGRLRGADDFRAKLKSPEPSNILRIQKVGYEPDQKLVAGWEDELRYQPNRS